MRRCPDAVVIKPNMAKYVEVGREVRKAMFDLTPLVEPLSIDEAFLDLTGTERLHGMSAGEGAGALCRARSSASSASRFRSACPPTNSSPRSPPTSTSRAASPCLARPRRRRSSRGKPVGFIYGVGAVSAAKLAADGFRTIADLQRADEHDLMRRYGEEGARLWRLARGIDARTVDPERDTKSISAETTFERDIGEFRPLEQHLWDLDRDAFRRG